VVSIPIGLRTGRLLIPLPPELSNDTIIRNHLSALYDTLLEQNLLRIIEPYSRVEMNHIAKLVRQPVREVETK
jgi:26S proteasome regulatory subunit N6